MPLAKHAEFRDHPNLVASEMIIAVAFPALNRLAAYTRRSTFYLLPLALLAVATSARLAFPDFIDRLSSVAYDLYQKADPRQPGDLPIRIVDIDDRSLKNVGQWPWPRSTIAELVDKLREDGAALVAFDIVFSEPDRLSPKELLPLLAKQAGEEDAKRVLAAMPDTDEMLAAAMRKLPVVASFALTEKGGSKTLLRYPGYVLIGGRDANPLIHVPIAPEAIADLPVLQAAARGDGFFNQAEDWDKVVRRVPMIWRLGNRPVFSLAAEVLRVMQSVSTYKVRGAGANAEKSFGTNTGLTNVLIGGADVPTDAAGRVWMHFSPRQRDLYISATDVLDGKVDRARLADKIVLIGTSATALNDIQATPVDPQMPGVEVHAQVIQQAMQDDFLRRPDWGEGAEATFTALVGILLVVLLPRIGALPSALLGGTAVAGALAVSWFGFQKAHLLISPVYPIMVLTAVYLLATLLSYLRTETQQRQIRGAFSRYMSPVLVDQLAAHPERLVLGGETKTLSIMFCDIRGFTTMSEGLDAQSLTKLINNFLTPMTEIITENKGTIDKYIGDCIMAFWNAPLDDPEHPKNAVRAAQGMRRRLVELNREWEAEAIAAGKPYKPLRIGIGINTGECTVGNFGSNQRFDYSIIGDPVNLASRLEGLGKLYGVDFVIGEAVAQHLDPDAELIELDLVAVKGKTQAVHVYTMPPERIDAADFANQHSALITAYRKQDWVTALSMLEDGRLAVARNLEPVYELYRRRITHFQLEAPPMNWDGVFTAEEK